jgi:hypothetical protein
VEGKADSLNSESPPRMMLVERYRNPPGKNQILPAPPARNFISNLGAQPFATLSHERSRQATQRVGIAIGRVFAVGNCCA